MGNHAAGGAKSLRQAVCSAMLAVPVLSACHDKGTLDSSRVEMVRVEGRRFEVRVAPADAEGEFRMLIVRATIVVNPDAEAERSRAENVAKPFMERSCRGQSYKVLDDQLIDNVTLSLRFRCVL
ncbi:MAG TPA: hypothetical protein VGO42_20120 [Reyranella sp.]|nr:hypothetical protein [Reyranella sp.]